jgi:hypothetical protein
MNLKSKHLILKMKIQSFKIWQRNTEIIFSIIRTKKQFLAAFATRMDLFTAPVRISSMTINYIESITEHFVFI